MFHVYTNWQGGRHVADVQNVTWGGSRGGMYLSEFGQNCGYFQLVFVNTSGYVPCATPIGPLVPKSPDGPKRSNKP